MSLYPQITNILHNGDYKVNGLIFKNKYTTNMLSLPCNNEEMRNVRFIVEFDLFYDEGDLVLGTVGLIYKTLNDINLCEMGWENLSKKIYVDNLIKGTIKDLIKSFPNTLFSRLDLLVQSTDTNIPAIEHLYRIKGLDVFGDMDSYIESITENILKKHKLIT